MAEVADACIYRGRAADALVRPDPSYANDAAYAGELKRRARFAPSFCSITRTIEPTPTALRPENERSEYPASAVDQRNGCIRG